MTIPKTFQLIAATALSIVSVGSTQARSDDPPAPDPASSESLVPKPPLAKQPQPPLAAKPGIAAIPPAARREAEIFLKDGRRVMGDFISQSDDAVIVSIGDIETRFAREFIDRVKIHPPIVERYRSLKASIDPRNLPARIELVRWLISKDCHDTALIEVNGVLESDPSNADGRELQILIAKQIELRDKAARHAEEESTKLAPKADPSAAKKRAKFPLLSKDDVNIIRVYEMDLNDPPRMNITREAIVRFLDKYAGQEGVPATREGRDAFLRRPVTDIVKAIFKARARESYSDIKVLDNPASMKAFRDSIHRVWLVNNCATAQCHGGEEAGRLMLASRIPNSDVVEYTNFYILDQFRLKDGTPLIDYVQPGRSPLLQYGLPPGDAMLRHPHVETAATHGRAGSTWRPVFSSPEDQRFQDAISWIESMYKPRPKYPITYTPPKPTPPVEVAKPTDPKGDSPTPPVPPSR
jgi:hypothetical protein